MEDRYQGDAGAPQEAMVPQTDLLGLGTAQQPNMLGLSAPTGFKKGGLVKAKASRKTRRGDGICQRGFTKGKMY